MSRGPEVGSRRHSARLHRAYDPKIRPLDENIGKMVSCGLKQLAALANTALEELIALDELEIAIKPGKKNKSPGHGGISHEFFKAV
jgi:hypothetical protein